MIAAAAGSEGSGLIGTLNQNLGYNSGPYNWLYASGTNLGTQLLRGLAAGLDPATANPNALGLLRRAVEALTAYIDQTVRESLGIESPSKVMVNLASNIPAGVAAGILAGIPDVEQATRALALAVDPGLAGLLPSSGQYGVSNERRIVVEFTGQVEGGAAGVPMAPWQFDKLKQELVYAVRTGA